MRSRPTPGDRRAVQLLCVVLAGLITMTACSGGDTPEAAPAATGAATGAAPGPAPTATSEPPPSTAGRSPASDETNAVDRADPATFDYEQVRPVDVEILGPDSSVPVEMLRLQFPSQDGGMASGYLAPPADPPTDVGILWAHGMQSTEMNWPGVPWDGRDSFAPMAVFACAGATSIVVNAPYARAAASRPDGAVTTLSEPLTFSSTDRDEQVQLIRDMRRAIDVLQDRGAERIGFGGISYGATIGAALLGVDDRIEAAKLTLGNSGLVDRFTDEEGDPISHLADRTAEEVEAWRRAMLPIEPVRFLGDTDAAILFLSGSNDTFVTRAEAERFHAAAPDGEVRWTNVGHDISFEDFLWHNRWLGTHLDMDTERLDACADEMFPGGW